MKPKRMILAGKIIAAIAGVCLPYAAYLKPFLAEDKFFNYLNEPLKWDLGLGRFLLESTFGWSETLWAALLIVGTMIALAGMILDRLDQSPRPPGSPGQG